MTADLLTATALAVAALPVTEVADGPMGAHALVLARRGWAVFPLRGKVPVTEHGVLDATTDLARVAEWWRRWPTANIGARVPDALFVLDVDPRHGADADELQRQYGPLPDTLTVTSGRGDGGSHRYYLHPGGKLTARHLPHGFDVKTSAGYCVVPPSLHPDTGRPYLWTHRQPVATPRWLVDLVRVPPPKPVEPQAASRLYVAAGSSIADDFAARARWADVLEPHGWRCRDSDGDADGARWLHPAATSPVSATVRHGCLFVYTPNTSFDTTEAGAPHGYTKFRAHAVLNHGGDMSAAARALRKVAA